MLFILLIINLDFFINKIRSKPIPFILAMLGITHQSLIGNSGFNIVGPSGIEFSILTYILCIFIYYIMPFNSLDKWCIYGLPIGTLLTTAVTFAQQISYNPLDFFYGSIGPYGLIGHPAWIVPLSIANIMLFFLYRKNIFLISSAFSLAVSSSKIAIIAISISMIIFVFVWLAKKDYRQIKLILPTFLLMFSTFFIISKVTSNVNTSINNISQNSAMTLKSRINIYKAAGYIFLKSPLLGSGNAIFYTNWTSIPPEELRLEIACFELSWNCKTDGVKQYGILFKNEQKKRIDVLFIAHTHNEIIQIALAGGIIYLITLAFIITSRSKIIVQLLEDYRFGIPIISLILYLMAWTAQIPSLVVFFIALMFCKDHLNRQIPKQTNGH